MTTLQNKKAREEYLKTMYKAVPEVAHMKSISLKKKLIENN
jgi:hypothetical protein